MPWTSDPGAGFTTGRPWLRFGLDADTRNVAAQGADPSSVLSLYRRLIALRATSQALQVGTLRLDPDTTGDLVAYTRDADGQVVVVVFNLGRSRASWRLPDGSPDGAWRPILGTSPNPAPGEAIAGGASLDLAPDEARVFERIG
jgi:glycosidase